MEQCGWKQSPWWARAGGEERGEGAAHMREGRAGQATRVALTERGDDVNCSRRSEGRKETAVTDRMRGRWGGGGGRPWRGA